MCLQQDDIAHLIRILYLNLASQSVCYQHQGTKRVYIRGQKTCLQTTAVMILKAMQNEDVEPRAAARAFLQTQIMAMDMAYQNHGNVGMVADRDRVRDAYTTAFRGVASLYGLTFPDVPGVNCNDGLPKERGGGFKKWFKKTIKKMFDAIRKREAQLFDRAITIAEKHADKAMDAAFTVAKVVETPPMVETGGGDALPTLPPIPVIQMTTFDSSCQAAPYVPDEDAAEVVWWLAFVIALLALLVGLAAGFCLGSGRFKPSCPSTTRRKRDGSFEMPSV